LSKIDLKTWAFGYTDDDNSVGVHSMQNLSISKGFTETLNRSLEERETVEERPFSSPEIRIVHFKPTSSV